MSDSYYDTRKLKEGKYLKVPKEFLKHMRIQDAVYLSFLIEMGIYAVTASAVFHHEKSDTDGWFRCSVDYVCRKLNMTPSQERRYMEVLVELGVVERVMMKNPARRFVKLDVERIEKLKKPVRKVSIRQAKKTR